MKSYFKKEMALLLTLLALTAGCGREAPPAEEGKIPVAASFGAMEKLTEAIGGDAVSISVMVPEGIEPHDFEPRAGDLIRLKQARVFVYNGMGMEHWAEKALQSAGAENQVVVRASEKVVPIPLEDKEEREEHGDYDPHTWLGLSEAKEEARAIRDGLIAASPENRDLFMKNYDTFAKSIDSLQQEYREKLAKAPPERTGHRPRRLRLPGPGLLPHPGKRGRRLRHRRAASPKTGGTHPLLPRSSCENHIHRRNDGSRPGPHPGQRSRRQRRNPVHPGRARQ